MKPWQWALLAGGAIIVIVLISRSSTTPQNGAVNTDVVAAAGLGGLLAGLFKGTTGSKVSAPSASPYADPGSTGFGPTTPASGAAYSQAMASTGYSASENAGPGPSSSVNTSGAFASASTGQPASSDAFGIGALQAPTFDIGTGGADFSN